MVKVFVVVLNWNQTKLTLETIASLKKLRVDAYELTIVVVDNASTQDISGLKRLKGVKLIRNKENLGFAAGNNVGLTYALNQGADWILVLNNDAVVGKDLVCEFLQAAAKYPRAGAMAPKIYFAKGFEFHKKRYQKADLGRVIWAAGGIIDWQNVLGSTRGVDAVDQGQFDQMQSIAYAPGTALFLKVEMLRQVGLFDPRYYLYYEDTDLSTRIKRADWQIIYVPRALVWHKVSQSSAIGGGLNDYFTTRNRMLLGMKYASVRTKFALLREGLRLLFVGRPWQRVGIRDYFLGRLGKGSWR